LQGDALEDLPFSVFSTESKRYEVDFRTGVLLSNSCDVSSDNIRITLPYAIFAMVHTVDEYVEDLNLGGISKARIDNFINDLRSNRITNLMYLPKLVVKGEVLVEESFLRFDRVANLPTTIVEQSYDKRYSPSGDRIFSLSQYGFFLFITKLSVHFCRFRENVVRSGF
jgi:hypothetical protein